MVNRKYSQKREAILEVLGSAKTHPTVEWIYWQVKQKYPEISLATVYRNLGMFCENGDVISVGVVNGKERFDTCTMPHGHFVCQGCDVVLDVDCNSNAPHLYDQIGKALNVSVHSHFTTYFGQCRDCLKDT